MASVTLKNVRKVFDRTVVAVDDFNLEIADKEFIVFVGPSGCGKSTTLRMIAGLEDITEGTIEIDGVVVNDLQPKDRDIAMVFQNYALYPHMTVYENIAFGLRMRRLPRREIDAKVREAAEILEISELLKRKPKALSGGQRQRVALGRAIVRDPKVFLMDEPLSNLDAKLRAQMRTELSKLHQKLATTFIYVTHDQVEAMTMGTRIVVMKDGFIQQVSAPQNLYECPANLFVATFIGTPQMNTITGTVLDEGGKTYVQIGQFKVPLPDDKGRKPEVLAYAGKEVIVGMRPENLYDEPENLAKWSESVVEAHVDLVEMMGSESYLYLLLEGQNFIARVSPTSTARSGDKVKIAIDNSKIHLFDKDTEKTITN